MQSRRTHIRLARLARFVFATAAVWIAAAALLSASIAHAQSRADAPKQDEAARQKDERFQPGSVTKIELSGYRGYFKVYTPKNYDAQRDWPVVLHYHGLRGKPSFGPFRKVTGGKNFILVALDHSSRRFHIEMPRDGMRQELAHLRKITQIVGRHLQVDRDQLFLTGSSRGAFMTTYVGEQLLPQLRGMALLAGGRTPNHGDDPPSPRRIRDMPIYIGIGSEDEAHMGYARNTRKFYKQWGADVTFEVWDGVGHSVKADSKLLYQWLISQGPLEGSKRKVKRARRLREAGRLGRAYATFQRMAAFAEVRPEATPKFVREAAKAAEALRQKAKKQLTSARQAIEQARYDQARDTLMALRRRFRDTPFAARATEQLKSLQQRED